MTFKKKNKKQKNMSLGSLNSVLRRIKMAKIHLKKMFIDPSS